MELSIRWFSCIGMLVVYSVGTNADRDYGDPFYQNLYSQFDPDIRYFETMQSLVKGYTQFRADDRRFQSQEVPDITPSPNTQFDFIVVGAGTAGCTVAARLSENPNWTVLLIEAGGSESLWMDIPLPTNVAQFNPNINWLDNSTGVKFCTRLNDRQCAWPRGKVMGGSSILSTMVATRGDRRDYDGWAKLGNQGWAWNDVLPYFKKLETMGVPEYRYDTKYHNFDGPLYVGNVPTRTNVAAAYLEAGMELGYMKVDYNGPSNTGFSYLQANIKDGSRMSNNRAYLHPIRDRRNLFVTKHSVVTKILIDNKTKRAFGVEFDKPYKINVFSSKEVIVCAGTIGSPQLLMLSGVGPAQHLRDKGITPLVDLPVGDNLQDHIAYGGLTFAIDQPTDRSAEDLLGAHLSYLREYFVNRVGPLTIPSGVEAIAFANLNNPRDWPNMEFPFLTNSVVNKPINAVSNINLGGNISLETERYITTPQSWSMRAVVMKPRSRRTIRLRNADIYTNPEMSRNYVDNTEDIKLLVKGIRFVLNFSRTPSMQRFGSRLNTTRVPGCENLIYDSDQYWECAVRNSAVDFYHYTSTCKMGPDSDPSAVVNPRLQVRGVEALRVADASVMPEIITGHTLLPTTMIAEKLADMVKQDWGYPIYMMPQNNRVTYSIDAFSCEEDKNLS